MTNANFSLTVDDDPDDLPRTLRRERDARLHEAREREARERAGTLTHSFGASDAGYDTQGQRHAPEPQPVAAAVTRFDVPFFGLMFFFIKAGVRGHPGAIHSRCPIVARWRYVADAFSLAHQNADPDPVPKLSGIVPSTPHLP